MLNHLTIELADGVREDVDGLEKAIAHLEKTNAAGVHSSTLLDLSGSVDTLKLLAQMMNDGHLTVTGPIPRIVRK